MTLMADVRILGYLYPCDVLVTGGLRSIIRGLCTTDRLTRLRLQMFGISQTRELGRT